MKIFIGGDHTGYDFKEEIKKLLTEQGHEVIDCGPYAADPEDDYPDFVGKAALEVSQNPGSMGIVMGGSGQGEQITANKFKGVRCALFYGPIAPHLAVDISGRESNDPFEMVKLTREHNNSNVLSLGMRFISKDDAYAAVKLFLETPFSEEARHVRRIKKIEDIESN